jgi:hypothetical protein
MRLRSLISVTVLALVACGGGGDDPTAPPTNLSGTYVLVSIDDAPLPVTLDDGTNTIEVVSNSITFTGRSFLDVLTASYNGSAPFTDEFPGDYTRTGAAIAMTYEDAETVAGTVDGEVLVLNFESGAWRYEK